MAKKKRPCKVCDYIRSHRGPNRVNEDLVNGISIAAIAQRTGLSAYSLKRHRDEGHMMKGYLNKAHLTKGAKEQLDLMRCAKEIYDMSIRAGKMALGDIPRPESADLRSLGGCLGPAAKIVEVLSRGDSNKEDDVPGIDRAIAKMKDSRDGK
jgi:hypothetical protein